MITFAEPIKLAGNVDANLENFHAEDIEQIYLLERKANPHPWSKNNFIDSYQNGHLCIGIKLDGNWIAHAVVLLAARDAELLIVAVAPEWQNRGVAKLFLRTIFSQLGQVAENIFLEVRESNVNAVKLYESLGLNCTGRRPDYYPNRKTGNSLETTYEDALLFAMDLSGC